MARVNAHLPDDLAEAARAAGLNLSAVLQAALRQTVGCRVVQAWYRAARAALPATPVANALAGTTLRDVREDDFGA